MWGSSIGGHLATPSLLPCRYGGAGSAWWWCWPRAAGEKCVSGVGGGRGEPRGLGAHRLARCCRQDDAAQWGGPGEARLLLGTDGCPLQDVCGVGNRVGGLSPAALELAQPRASPCFLGLCRAAGFWDPQTFPGLELSPQNRTCLGRISTMLPGGGRGAHRPSTEVRKGLLAAVAAARLVDMPRQQAPAVGEQEGLEVLSHGGVPEGAVARVQDGCEQGGPQKVPLSPPRRRGTHPPAALRGRMRPAASERVLETKPAPTWWPRKGRKPGWPG